MNKEMVKRIADRMVYGGDKNWSMNIESFDWVPGVGLYGILMAYEYLGDKAYLDFLIAWADNHLEEAYMKRTVNATAPLIVVAELYKLTSNQRYLNICTDIGDWLIGGAPITCDGGLEHTVTEEGVEFREQIWADTLFMACIFLTKLGNITQKNEYIDFAVNQLNIHHELLVNPKTGLYYHGWDGEKRNNMSCVSWGRANAWILYSTLEISRLLGGFHGMIHIEKRIKKHVEALSNWQREDGSFGTIIDEPSSYSEISATAGIAAGIRLAVKMGVSDKKHMSMSEKAVQAVSTSVMLDGTVDGVSSGTPIMPSAQAYNNIEICPALYGQTLAIIALLGEKGYKDTD